MHQLKPSNNWCKSGSRKKYWLRNSALTGLRVLVMKIIGVGLGIQIGSRGILMV